MADVPRGETVFCHECGNRWSRRLNGLICSRCNSEFVEVLESDSGETELPELGRRRSPLGFPATPEPFDWREPRNVTHREYRPHDGGFSYVTTSYRSSGSTTRTRRDSPRPPQLGAQHGDLLRTLRDFSDLAETLAYPGSTTRSRTTGAGIGEPNFVPPAAASPFLGAAGFPQHGPQPGAHRNAANPLNDFLQTITDITAQQAENRAGGQGPGFGPPPFIPLLNQLLGNMGHGRDAVRSEEEFDRVMTQFLEQNQGGNAPPPAPQNAISRLPKKVVDQSMMDDDGNAECSICMDNVEIGMEVTMLPCNHWFHGQCISAWLAQHGTCPHCRHSIMAPAPVPVPTPAPAPAPVPAPARGVTARANQRPITPAAPAGSRENPFVVTDFSLSPPAPVPQQPQPQRPRRQGSGRGGHGWGGWLRSPWGGGPGH